jgi:hypothetical protein
MNELDAAAIMRLNTQLEDLQGVVGDGHLAEAAKVAAGRHFEPTPHRGCYPWLLSTTQKMFPSVSARTMKSGDSG